MYVYVCMYVRMPVSMHVCKALFFLFILLIKQISCQTYIYTFIHTSDVMIVTDWIVAESCYFSIPIHIYITHKVPNDVRASNAHTLHIHIHIYICMYIYIHIHIHTYTYTYIHICITHKVPNDVRASNAHTLYIHIHIHIHIHMHVHVHIHTYTYTYIYIYITYKEPNDVRPSNKPSGRELIWL